MPITFHNVFLLTMSRQCIQEVLDLYIAVLIAFTANEVHFLANLFKIIQGIGILNKYFIGIILNPQVRQIHKACGGGAANPLLHGFGGIAEAAAQFMQSDIVQVLMIGNHVFCDGDNILTSKYPYDPKSLQYIGEGGRGYGSRGSGGRRLPGRGILEKNILYPAHGAAHGEILLYSAYDGFHLDTVDRLLDEEFNARFIGGGNHILGGHLREHDKYRVGKKRAHLSNKRDSVCIGHEEINNDGMIRKYSFFISWISLATESAWV